MKKKLTNYWTYLSLFSAILAFLDPSTKFETFDKDDCILAINYLKAIYLLYQKNQQETDSEPVEDSLEIFQNWYNQTKMQIVRF